MPIKVYKYQYLAAKESRKNPTFEVDENSHNMSIMYLLRSGFLFGGIVAYNRAFFLIKILSKYKI